MIRESFRRNSWRCSALKIHLRIFSVLMFIVAYPRFGWKRK